MRKLIGALLAVTALVPVAASAQEDRGSAQLQVEAGPGPQDAPRADRPRREGGDRGDRGERRARGGFGGGPRAGVDAPDRQRPQGWGDDLRGMRGDQPRGGRPDRAAWGDDRRPDAPRADAARRDDGVRGDRGPRRERNDRGSGIRAGAGVGIAAGRQDRFDRDGRFNRDDRDRFDRDDRDRFERGRGDRPGRDRSDRAGNDWAGDDWAGNDWGRSAFNRDRGGWRDDRRGGVRGGWNRGWRQDRRYDWNRYRGQNRAAYRLPRYYAPYGAGYGYRRFQVGVGLQAAFWGRNYWIADPFAYRLPPADGPYRWVRYYDDALLIDLRSGLVVDAVYDIFW